MNFGYLVIDKVAHKRLLSLLKVAAITICIPFYMQACGQKGALYIQNDDAANLPTENEQTRVQTDVDLVDDSEPGGS